MTQGSSCALASRVPVAWALIVGRSGSFRRVEGLEEVESVEWCSTRCSLVDVVVPVIVGSSFVGVPWLVEFGGEL